MSTQVLHVIARMNVGGTARYIGELVEKIPDSRLATGFVQGNEVEDACVGNFKVLRIHHMGRKISPINDLRAWLELRKIVKEINPSIVHTHTFKAGLIGRLVGGKHKRIHTFHGHLFGDQSFSPLQKYLISRTERYLARRTNLLISVGKKVGMQLQLEGIGPNQNWMSIPPGVAALPIIEKSQAREQLRINNDGLLVGWLARMAEVKNPMRLLKVAARMPDVNFVMAGGGDLLEKVRTNAPPNVEVIGWADAAKFWSAVDIAISTSENEGMPVALIEAQLAGLPVIATDVGSNAEVIESGVTGIITSKNVEEMVSAINRLSSDRAEIALMGNSAKVRSSKEFSINNMILAHKNAYSQILT